MKRFRSVFSKWLPACLAASLFSISSVLYADAAGQWRDGAHVYSKICGFCHETGIGPVIKGRELPPEYVAAIVRNGFRAMPTFRQSEIDDEALAKLSSYVSTAPVNSP